MTCIFLTNGHVVSYGARFRGACGCRISILFITISDNDHRISTINDRLMRKSRDEYLKPGLFFLN